MLGGAREAVREQMNTQPALQHSSLHALPRLGRQSKTCASQCMAQRPDWVATMPHNLSHAHSRQSTQNMPHQSPVLYITLFYLVLVDPPELNKSGKMARSPEVGDGAAVGLLLPHIDLRLQPLLQRLQVDAPPDGHCAAPPHQPRPLQRLCEAAGVQEGVCRWGAAQLGTALMSRELLGYSERRDAEAPDAGLYGRAAGQIPYARCWSPSLGADPANQPPCCCTAPPLAPSSPG